MPVRTRLLLALALLALVGLSRAAAARDPGVYAGVGTWVDIYDRASWRHPERTVELMASRGVGTLFLETSNYRQSVDLVRPDALARFIQAAHRDGIAVVAWYLPSLARPALDQRRALAAIRFQTPQGEGFDAFALDIEARVVRSPARRSAQLLALSARLRAASPRPYLLGAIIPSPIWLERDRSYWPGFPYPRLARLYDVFLPMDYFSSSVRGARRAYAYVARSIAIIRAQARGAAPPIHVIAGLAEALRPAEVAAVLGAAADCGAVGTSLYDFRGTSAQAWALVAGFPAAAGTGTCG